MARDNVSNAATEYPEELHSVACIHCGKKVFTFSKNLFHLNRTGYGSGDVTLICPLCGGTTEVWGNGTIKAGQ
jgi:hypothetical protein